MHPPFLVTTALSVKPNWATTNKKKNKNKRTQHVSYFKLCHSAKMSATASTRLESISMAINMTALVLNMKRTWATSSGLATTTHNNQVLCGNNCMVIVLEDMAIHLMWQMGLVSCLVSVGCQIVSVWSVWSIGSRVEWSLYLANYFSTAWSFASSGSLCFNPTFAK